MRSHEYSLPTVRSNTVILWVAAVVSPLMILIMAVMTYEPMWMRISVTDAHQEEAIWFDPEAVAQQFFQRCKKQRTCLTQDAIGLFNDILPSAEYIKAKLTFDRGIDVVVRNAPPIAITKRHRLIFADATILPPPLIDDLIARLPVIDSDRELAHDDVLTAISLITAVHMASNGISVDAVCVPSDAVTSWAVVVNGARRIELGRREFPTRLARALAYLAYAPDRRNIRVVTTYSAGVTTAPDLYAVHCRRTVDA